MAGPYQASRFDIADIVRDHRGALQERHWLTRQQRRVLTDIVQCRTEALGGHREACSSCGFERDVYRSCRNRHCPKCQALAQEKWIEEQRQRTLDVTHFHIVFTLPAELRPLATFRPRVVYDALLHCVGRTLVEFGKSRWNATLGATLVLHTWTRELLYHPHAHAIVTGGGLTDDGRFFRSEPKYCFSIAALGTVFRAKLLDALGQAYSSDAFAGFDDFEDPEGFSRLMRKLPKKWFVYAKPSFDRGQHVLQYLGRYTHRVGIANSRLLDVGADSVVFRTKGAGTKTLHPVEFLNRFVRHVLPDGFHKIRHFGLNASAKKRDAARLALQQDTAGAPSPTWQQRLAQLTGRDVRRCPCCKSELRASPLQNRSRAPPGVTTRAA